MGAEISLSGLDAVNLHELAHVSGGEFL